MKQPAQPFEKKVQRGNKVYRFNFVRIAATALLLVGLIVLGICMTVEKLSDHKQAAVLQQQYAPLCVTSVPDAGEQSQRRCIVLDPGHGGSDSGAAVDDVQEKQINLQICLEAESRLRALGYTVLLTRCDDADVDTQACVDKANALGADVYVAVHQNAMENDTTTHGVETWYETGNDLNTLLAQCLQDAVTAATDAESLGIKDADDYDTGFMVTGGTQMPSALIETGFLTNAQECELLQSRAYQKKIAQGIVDALEDFFEQADLADSAFSFES
jgi:N-acetylmuramoyl-L-alanine amidase